MALGAGSGGSFTGFLPSFSLSLSPHFLTGPIHLSDPLSTHLIRLSSPPPSTKPPTTPTPFTWWLALSAVVPTWSWNWKRKIPARKRGPRRWKNKKSKKKKFFPNLFHSYSPPPLPLTEKKEREREREKMSSICFGMRPASFL